jgi:hypothetical protein
MVFGVMTRASVAKALDEMTPFNIAREKGSPNGSPGGASPVNDDLFFGDSDEGQKPAAKAIGKGRGAEGNPSFEEYEEAIKLPAHMLKDPPATASVAQADKATGNRPAQTPGRTPRVQPPTQANPSLAARRRHVDRP